MAILGFSMWNAITMGCGLTTIMGI